LQVWTISQSMKCRRYRPSRLRRIQIWTEKSNQSFLRIDWTDHFSVRSFLQWPLIRSKLTTIVHWRLNTGSAPTSALIWIVIALGLGAIWTVDEKFQEIKQVLIYFDSVAENFGDDLEGYGSELKRALGKSFFLGIGNLNLEVRFLEGMDWWSTHKIRATCPTIRPNFRFSYRHAERQIRGNISRFLTKLKRLAIWLARGAN